MKNKVIIEVETENERSVFSVPYYIIQNENGAGIGLIPKSLCTDYIEPAEIPVERKSIGTYEGVAIYEDTKAWYIDNEKLSIITVRERTTIEGWSNDYGRYTKAYLTVKEANQRLKEEVTKVAKNRTFTFKELEVYNFSIPLTYAIELVEKERGVIYLKEE